MPHASFISTLQCSASSFLGRTILHQFSLILEIWCRYCIMFDVGDGIYQASFVINFHFVKHFQMIKVNWGRVEGCRVFIPSLWYPDIDTRLSKTQFPARVPRDQEPMFHQSRRNGFLIPGSGRGFNNSITRIINDPPSHTYAATVSWLEFSCCRPSKTQTRLNWIFLFR